MTEDGEQRIKEGFPGQRSIVLPRPVVSGWLDGRPLIELLPSDVGHYPRAQWHFVERPEGISQWVLIYCTAGCGWARVGNASLRIRPGQALVAPAGAPHAYGADPDDPWTIYWVHLDGTKVAMLPELLELDSEEPLLHPGRDPAIPTLFEKMLSILGRGYTPDNLLSASMALGQLVTHLVVLRHRSPNRDDNLDQRIRRVIDVMQGNLGRSLKVDELAREANLSSSHLAAVFKKRTGFTVLDFFIRLKIQRACFLLDTTDQSVKAIAADLGFDDPLYFSRCFRRVHDNSPTQYRALRKG